MVEVEVGKHHVGDVSRLDPPLSQGLVQVLQVKELVVAERFQVLVSRSVIHQDDPSVRLDQEGTHGQYTAVLRVAGIASAPGCFGYRAKHRSSVCVEVTGVNRKYFHFCCFFVCKGSGKNCIFAC